MRFLLDKGEPASGSSMKLAEVSEVTQRPQSGARETMRVTGMGTGMTPEEIAIAARYDSGESSIALAHRTGLSRPQINRILKDAGVPRRPQPNIATLPKNTRGWIVKLSVAGWPTRTIAQELGLEINLVRDVLRLEGIEIVPGRRHRRSLPANLPHAEPAPKPPPLHEQVEPPPPGPTPQHTEARKIAEEIVAAYEDGATVTGLSAIYKYPEWRIARILASAEAKQPLGPSQDETIEQPRAGNSRLQHLVTDEHGLTARQRSILELIVHGRTTRQIARQMRHAESTIRSETTRIYAALGVAGRWQAAQAAVDRKLV